MDTLVESSIGSRIRKVRLNADCTQKSFGVELGVSLPTVNRVENNQRSPTAELLVEISRKFGTDLNWLLTGVGEMVRENERSGNPDNVKIPLFKKLSKNLIDTPDEDVASLLSLPDVPTNAVACKGKDDACAPRINSRDIVIFEPGDCESGDLVVASDEWGNALIRNMQMQGDKIFYVADHQGYERLRDGDVTCLGKVWGTIRKLAKP